MEEEEDTTRMREMGSVWGSMARMEGVGEEVVPSTACSTVPAASGDRFLWRRERERKSQKWGSEGRSENEDDDEDRWGGWSCEEERRERYSFRVLCQNTKLPF